MDILEMVKTGLEIAQVYWPFIVKLLVLWYAGQFFKKRVWTKTAASYGNAWGWISRQARATLPLHPLAVGALWGCLFPWLPAVTFVNSRGGAVQEGLLAGLVSVVGFVVLEHLAVARKWDWVLKVLKEAVPERQSNVPPEV